MKRTLQVMGIGVAALVIGGCAGMRSAQDVKRLQSQVGLLDERVSQLERASGTWPSAGTISEPGTDGAAVTVSGGKAASASSKGITSSSKPSTREIQQALKNAGFYQGAVDGKMGSGTREAIKEFQRVHGLTDDGVVGKKTWAKLSAYTTLSSGSDSGAVNAAEILK